VDVLEMATIGGAAAIGIDSEVGTLEEGKQADLAAFVIDPIAPIQDPVTAAVFSITAGCTRFVSVAGKPLVRDGKIVQPRPGLAGRVQELAEKLAAWLADDGEMKGVV
jgi:5-methylthioadenosine/S-adenosylhomocysteine deaminase